jgi:hypothetical protein
VVQPFLSLAQQEEFPLLLLATGCGLTAIINAAKGDIVEASVMGLYAFSCVSIYALQRYDGVVEAVRAHTSRKGPPSGRNTPVLYPELT